ncbi:MAG: transcriptional regulator NrdR [Candidatus Jacksonbacteria bacterium RIFOXYC2_FULL_44_29]|nr:MAG: Transcriptional repressor NrdR [Parcubacteria group bacterium GW2011_GWC2_44_22]OGY76894.1 MAG: transcriptional regulator NrdR [Candidatus Jacksonbacteria bacterium RIFOXYA2_FULL_43_12]OGY77345.1 MAG: transcriptional regulator NrdR [Candidatus Jacksonbacteria bacterium RIFOXYB2_FULL_44_15]OGY79561.1 MAG: transcriptional regulator NrdR [Candidatus Jacksonbacteria bacterium RIFOXYC2_FULL_44_29]OGY82282.1 MAG: transcriptional regulator NrdR [Candidatus Jacksonbacteria bacterium RIFOXYD2_FU
MNCPICHQDTKVLESRTTASNTSIRRRRQCVDCFFRFSTLEEIEILDLDVIKRDQTRENYSHEKLTAGLIKALQKRTYTPEAFKRLISNIERDIQIKSQSDAITTDQIGEIVIQHLKNFDKVAYVRFASVYRDFKEPQDFATEVRKLKT